jgi:hypothetical protein
LTFVSGSLRRELLAELKQTQAPSGPSREQLQAAIAQLEVNMRSEPGSPSWKAYWTQGGAAACLDARRAIEALDMPTPTQT